MVITCSLGGGLIGPEIMLGNHVLEFSNGFGVIGLLCSYLYDCSDRSPLQKGERMQEVTAVIPIMGKPSFKWESSTEQLPGMYVYPLTTKPLRGAR